MNSIFRLENITKYYSDKTYIIKVLEDLCFDIKPADMIAITGKSGSGKSTLLHIMGFLDTPNSGVLYFQEKPISATQKNIELFRNTHIGFVFQFHYLLADFTAQENVAMPHAIAGNTWSEAKQKAKVLLTELDLGDRLNHYPNQLSGGEQQRVAIARALINQPDIIIADEPTGNLDKVHSDEIINILKRINKEKEQTIIVATHDLEIANNMKSHYHLDSETHKLEVRGQGSGVS
jgi:lipoprotein-releasing system ATP-binding protein